MQQPANCLIFAQWIITLDPAKPVLTDHALAIAGDRISAILPTVEARKLAADKIVELPNHALMPGLINSHGHAAMSLFRGMADDLPLDTWLNEHIWPAEGQWVSEEFVRDGVELAMAEMIRSGTTTFSDMYFFPNIAAKTITKAGMRAQLAFPVFEFPSNWGQTPDEYIHKGLQVHDDNKHNPLITVAFGPHAPYTVGDDTMSRVATLAAELHDGEFNIQIHTHETDFEVEQSIKDHGMRPIQRLAERGLLGPRTQCVHLVSLNDDDIQTLADHNCHAVHCPESNMKLASGFSPVKKMLDAGINVALGTDGAASNNTLNLFNEMRAAALLAKGLSGDACAVPDSLALQMATLNGARAMGLDNDLGSLEIGKLADVIAVDLSAVEQQPVYEPISQLVYTQAGSAVSHSWINGKLVMDNRLLTTLNIDDIRERAQAWRQQIAKTS
ncbi:5-methylthioadenosine/S-adenosylhomocysteine deaminase [Litorivivens lipolytica]|uniref:5-methylthioadenosine/S-adenosylhomocysteine deaminase n=1 Tax=Litorivivens lipolytica TaxID=1524264 RepID=A0A7W4W3L5_9GAMM|nr:TRZ/ATZ family hydrolase [Litorivivens lipolytica]MBB3046779.1 5-methylthioadenosine/S-adenosylhomocysteine deaminase [Litorivivens lipolytica]